VKPRLAGLLLGAAVLLADQGAKYWVLHNAALTNGDFLTLLPVLNFVLVWNHGVTFGMFTSFGTAGKFILAALALAVVAGLVVWLWRAGRWLPSLAIGAIAGGAVGNVADRLRHGAVVDFIQAHIGAYSWYVFNIGDAAIVCGVAALMLESLLRREPVAASSGQR
jgi:signal peptidase II